MACGAISESFPVVTPKREQRSLRPVRISEKQYQTLAKHGKKLSVFLIERPAAQPDPFGIPRKHLAILT
jgi:hypothetical protein